MRRVFSSGGSVLRAGLLAGLVATLGACVAGSADSGGRYNNDPGGPQDPRPGAPPPPRPPPNPSGGGGAAGGGGSVAVDASSGGSPGPGAGADASAASADAGAVPPPLPPPGMSPPGAPGLGPPCGVTISPVSPQRFTDIPAGEGYRLRVGGRAEGSRVGRTPTWRWTIVHESNLTVPHKVVEGDPAVVEFPTEMTGRYSIQAEILGTPDPCTDRKTAYAVVPNRLFAKFRVRATPPAGRPLALFEADVVVSAGTPVTKTIDLQRGYPVTIDPQDERGFELPAYYVRVSGRSSTARFDGYVVPSRRMGFQALLELGQRYDVLLVPDAQGPPAARAPLAYSGLLAEEFGLQSFRVNPGTRVAGVVLNSDGTPLAGARVRLRSGALPSTVGQTDAAGVYELRVRGGRFEVRVVPPDSSGLPEAQLPESTGFLIGDAPADLPLDFSYGPASGVRLGVTVQGPAGGAALAGVRVQLESESGALPDVGTFRLDGGARIPAAGVVRRVRTTDASGVATFEALPRTRYRAVLVPPDDAPGDPAITLTELDVGAVEAPVNARTVTLGSRSRLTGRLLPAAMSAGLVVKAVDTGEEGAGRTVTATVGADGRYEVPTDPGRVYRLFIEPPADRRVSRIPLEPFRAKATGATLDRTLPMRLGVSGAALENGSPAPGVLVQVFCVGAAPTCIDAEAPDVTGTAPIDETVSGPDGRYQLWVPDPGQ